jgi:peptide/nickel transport system permease protein
MVLISVLSENIAPYDVMEQSLRDRLKPPSQAHIFGTDEFGRDVLSRVLVGGKTSVIIGIVSVAISMIAGVTLGLLAGFSGRADMIIMRFIDIMMALPGILLAMAIVAALGPTVFNVIIAVAFFSVPTFARVVRADVLALRDREFVTASALYGLSDFRIITNHILPNVLHSVIVVATMQFATSVLTSAGLSFLGMGVQPPTPDWGAMINQGRRYIRTAWWLIAFPSAALCLFTITINVVGDALRDAFDPK